MAATDDALENAKAALGEQFQHYAIVVQYDDGDIWHEGNNSLVEKALYKEALTIIKEEREWEDSDVDIDWDDDNDGDDWKVAEEEQ